MYSDAVPRRYILDKQTHGKIGLRVAGGCDTPAGAIFVTHLYPVGAAAHSGITVGCRVLAVNGLCALLTPQSQVRRLMSGKGAPVLEVLGQELEEDQYQLVYSATEKIERPVAMPMIGIATAGEIIEYDVRRLRDWRLSVEWRLETEC